MEKIKEYYDNAIQRSKKEIDDKEAAYLLNVNADELAQYYEDRFRLPLIELDPSREIKALPMKAVIRTDSRWGERIREIPLMILYPIIPKSGIEDVIHRGASTFYSFQGDSLDFDRDALRVTVYLKEKEENQESKIMKEVRNLEELISWRNKDVKEGNKRLKPELLKHIHLIQKQLQADKELVERTMQSVSITLEQRTTSIPVVDFTVRKEIVPVYPKAKVKVNLKIESEKVDAVISLLKRCGMSFETTPEVYSTKLNEEELRNILLSQLNAVFKGRATGETFVKKGKTDIHLDIDEGSILCAECKFWDGEEKYRSMMEQLSGYLTWRQNYGILITFSRKKEFSSILEKAKNAALNFPTTIPNSLREIDEGHFVTKNTLLEDTQKKVTLHHLLFNLYYNE